MLLSSRSIANAAASNAEFGRATFSGQTPAVVATHGGGGGVGAGVVGVEFISPAQTGTPTASASISEAKGFRQILIGGLLKRKFLASQIQFDWWSQLEVSGRAHNTRLADVLQEPLHTHTKEAYSCTYMTR